MYIYIYIYITHVVRRRLRMRDTQVYMNLYLVMCCYIFGRTWIWKRCSWSPRTKSSQCPTRPKTAKRRLQVNIINTGCIHLSVYHRCVRLSILYPSHTTSPGLARDRRSSSGAGSMHGREAAGLDVLRVCRASAPFRPPNPARLPTRRIQARSQPCC